MIFELSDALEFPDPHLADDDGLLAIGGDLSPRRLLLAYHYGIFPWFDYRNEGILWWCPKRRFVIFPDEIHISHSMRQLIRSGRFSCSVNKAFDQVIKNCSQINNRIDMPGAWLGEEMIDAYKTMNRLGYAYSVEVWEDDSLVGGLYGIMLDSLGNNSRATCNFFGESMFSLVPNASKYALIYIATLMQETGGIIDCQFETSHLKSMGGRYISYDEYMEYLGQVGQMGQMGQMENG